MGAVFAGSAFAAIGCEGEHLGVALLDGEQPARAAAKVDPCSKPKEGCPCEEGQVSECGSFKESQGNYVICKRGERTCKDGQWSECMPKSEVVKERSLRAVSPSRFGFKALGMAESCENLCDPECVQLVDTPVNLTPPEGLQASPDGLTLVGSASGGSCSDITLTPASRTLTVSAIAANGTITISPANAHFDASCAGGAPVSPSWSIDKYDRAVINDSGTVTVFSGEAGSINVSAKSSVNTAMAVVNVKVAIGTLDAAGPSNDPGRTLYPYSGTLFPLDIKAPLVQYQTGGTNASRVQVALRYPAGSAAPTFLYVQTFGTSDPKQGTLNSNVPAWQPPQAIWNAFGRTVTANGGMGDIVIRRKNGGTTYKEMTIPLRFAQSPLRGTVYYTQYVRRLTSAMCTSNAHAGERPQTGGSLGCTFSGASYVPGQICPVGNRTHPYGVANTSMTRAIDLSLSSAPNKDPFGGTAGCPVCHSLSADGSTYVSGSQSWQTVDGASSRGINKVSLNAMGNPVFTKFGDRDGKAPSYTGLADEIIPTAGNNYNCSNDGVNLADPSAGDNYNNCERTDEWSRGFGYAAINPDASWLLQGPAFWGNTQETPSSNNIQDATMKGLTGGVKPYFLINPSSPGLGVQAASTASLGGSLASNVLTASSNGTLGNIDGVPMAVGRAVLLKNQTDAKQNGVYVVTNMGSAGSKWQLTRRYDANSSAEMAQNTEVRVSDGTTNRGKTFYVSTANVVLNTSNLTFTDRNRPALPNMMTPVFSPDGTKVAYVNADADTIAGSSTGWRRGLSMFTFDKSTPAISNKKRLLNNWSGGTTGTPLKWPFFESDNRSLVYVETEPTEFCSASDSLRDENWANTIDKKACYEAPYGSMSPTTRGRWKGSLYSIDTAAANPSATRAALAKLNKADDVTGGPDSVWNDRAYQPNVLPFTAGGYRWVIFTSPRNYGNQLNSRFKADGGDSGNSTHFTCASPMLWMAAIENTTATATDRSYPAFLLPGQNMANVTSDHYINERGYLVPSPCKPQGSSCTASDECCDYNHATAPTACRADSAWTPASGPLTRSCQQQSGTCSHEGESCETASDCCAPNSTCELFTCSSPPAFEAATFERDYQAECPSGYHPDWKTFNFHLTTEGDSRITFQAQTASTLNGLATATKVVLGTSTDDVVPPVPAKYYDVGAAFDASVSSSRISRHMSFVRISMVFTPSTDGVHAPVLHDWEMRHTCVASE